MIPQHLQGLEFNYQDLLDLSKPDIQNQNVPKSSTEVQSTQKTKNKSETKKKRTTSKLQGKKKGHWENQQNKKYHWFLEIYHTHFMKKHLRRVDRIFKVMENFLGTRQAQQCRSHHQKMQKRYGDFKNILLYLRMNHYGSQQSSPVSEDLQKNEVKLIDRLVSRQQLREQQEKIEEQQENYGYQKQIEMMKYPGNNIQNLLDEDYEQGMNFDHFIS